MKVISNDGEEFEIDDDIAKQSTLLKSFSDGGIGESIPLSNVKGSILKSNDPQLEPIDDDDDDDPNRDIYEPKRLDDISEWDRLYIRQFTVEDDSLFDIITAANYLDIKTLLSVGCKAIANMIRGKSSSEIRQMFNNPADSNGKETTESNNISELIEKFNSNNDTASSGADSMNKHENMNT